MACGRQPVGRAACGAGCLVYIILRFLNDFESFSNAPCIPARIETRLQTAAQRRLIRNAKAIRLKISTDPAHTLAHYLKIPPAHKLAKGCAGSCPAGKYAMGSRCPGPIPSLEIWQTIMRSSFITNARQL